MSNVKTRVVGGAVGLAIIVLLVLMKSHRDPAKRPDLEQTDSSPGYPINEVVSVRAPTPTVPSAKKWLSPPPAIQARSDHGIDPFVAKDPMNEPTFQAAATIKKMQKLQSIWESGKPDSAFARQVDDYILSEFAKKQMHARLTELDCRTTACRVTMEFDSAEGFSELNRFEYPPSNGGMFDVYTGEGRNLVRMFLAPAGASLSAMFANTRR